MGMHFEKRTDNVVQDVVPGLPTWHGSAGREACPTSNRLLSAWHGSAGREAYPT